MLRTRLLYKFRSGSHVLNEELHVSSIGEGVALCGDECESVVHVLWEFPACKDSGEQFWLSSGLH